MSRPYLRPQLIPLLVFGSMLFVSWRKWTGMIVDIGRETDLPRRLLEGELLYRDIHYLYPPLSPYLNASIFGVFGVSLDTLAFSGIFFTALLAFLSYLLARKLLGPLESSLAVSAIILLCFFKPAGNSILPYSFATVHAAVFNLAALLFLIRNSRSGRSPDLLVAGLFVGLSVITKQEFGFASAATAVIYLAFRHGSDIRKLIGDLVWVSAPAFAVAAPVYGIFFYLVDWRTLVYDCSLFYTDVPDSLVQFNRWRSGFDHPFASLVQMTGAFAVGTAIVSLLVLVSDRNRRLTLRASAAAAVSAAVAAGVLFLYIEDWEGSPLRAMPFVLIAVILTLWFRGGGDEEDNGGGYDRTTLFIISVYSLLILFRAILRVPSGGFSGGSYLITSLIVVYFGLLVWLPRAVGRWTVDDLSRLRARRLAVVLSVLPIIGLFVSFTIRYERRFDHRIDARRGTLYAETANGKALEQAIRFIESNTSENEAIAVFPEGNDLAFLTGRRINLRHQILIPGFLDREDELAAIESLERANVRYIFVVNRPMREFGGEAFGRDFYRTLGKWIEENFRVVEVFGREKGSDAVIGEGPFFIKVYERESSTAGEIEKRESGGR